MSNLRAFVIAVVIVATLGFPGTALAQAVETPAERDARMQWWRDARFGMFIHWGLYSIPAGEWNGQTNHAEWIRTTAQIPLAQYDNFVAQFNPVKFDAAAWVRMAKDAGMKYIVITTKHHDGFCLFDSKQTDFDIMATPYGRDIMRQLAEACRAEGIRMCWYHSIMDWHHPDYLPRRDWEKSRTAEGADFNRYTSYLHNEVAELLTNYGDIGVMWFDGEWENTWTHEQGKTLYELCRSLQPNVIINNRVDTGRSGMAGMTAEGEFVGDFGTPEQEIPATGVPGVDWETCMTMNGNWGYNRNDHNWKSAEDLIHKLVDIASKGGNFLLNIGPTAEGEFPPEAVERLKAIGAWMNVNGESIYGTSASPFARLDWGRCTMKTHGETTTLYLHAFKWPKDGVLVVPGLGNDKFSARLLGPGATALSTSRAGSDLHITVPAVAPDAIDTVIALEVAGEPIVYEPPVIDAPANILVKPMNVTIAASAAALEARYTLDGSEPTAQSPVANGPISISDSCVLRTRTFHDGRPASAIVERRFTLVNPRPAESSMAGTIPGVMVAVYEGDWSNLPDFSQIRPTRLTHAATIELPSGPAQEHVARVFSGWIHVPSDDVYEFSLTSDDGSRMMIVQRVIVENNGLHSSREERGVVALSSGWHKFIVQHFNKSGQAECTLRMAPAGQPLQPIHADSYRRTP